MRFIGLGFEECYESRDDVLRPRLGDMAPPRSWQYVEAQVLAQQLAEFLKLLERRLGEALLQEGWIGLLEVGVQHHLEVLLLLLRLLQSPRQANDGIPHGGGGGAPSLISP